MEAEVTLSLPDCLEDRAQTGAVLLVLAHRVFRSLVVSRVELLPLVVTTDAVVAVEQVPWAVMAVRLLAAMAALVSLTLSALVLLSPTLVAVVEERSKVVLLEPGRTAAVTLVLLAAITLVQREPLTQVVAVVVVRTRVRLPL